MQAYKQRVTKKLGRIVIEKNLEQCINVIPVIE